ncbi:ParA family protein [Suttonella ornithocola]|uniref:Sporulation initiation inhibitor protein soj n=1 Tax=Suttonella ornithocola TaxID=279832 RepID=A0A380MX54_9GAMM|nr:ParA family protein [Suttonella ornithocola]SUO95997.1 Sporulation initiation inhibitor protein soj [Suttonella ornithocola]
MSIKILAVTNQKGGVGKTTTAVSLAAVLAEQGEQVLLIDMDPQANATVACGLNRREIALGVMDVLKGTHAPEDIVIYREDAKFWLLPANDDLTATDVTMAQNAERHNLLKKYCTGWIERFDWVLIDCPPTLNLLTINAMVLSHYVLVPIQCEYFALEGVSALLDTIGQIRQSVNPQLKVAGFIRTMYDPRSRLTREVSESLLEHLNQLVFSEVVPRNIRLAEAPSYGLPITQYDGRSKGAVAYRAIARELVQRIGN